MKKEQKANSKKRKEKSKKHGARNGNESGGGSLGSREIKNCECTGVVATQNKKRPKFLVSHRRRFALLASVPPCLRPATSEIVPKAQPCSVQVSSVHLKSSWDAKLSKALSFQPARSKQEGKKANKEYIL